MNRHSVSQQTWDETILGINDLKRRVATLEGQAKAHIGILALLTAMHIATLAMVSMLLSRITT